MLMTDDLTEIEVLWLVETDRTILLVRAPTADEAVRELTLGGYPEPLRIAKYGFNLTQKGVVFSFVKDLVFQKGAKNDQATDA